MEDDSNGQPFDPPKVADADGTFTARSRGVGLVRTIGLMSIAWIVGSNAWYIANDMIRVDIAGVIRSGVWVMVSVLITLRFRWVCRASGCFAVFMLLCFAIYLSDTDKFARYEYASYGFLVSGCMLLPLLFVPRRAFHASDASHGSGSPLPDGVSP